MKESLIMKTVTKSIGSMTDVLGEMTGLIDNGHQENEEQEFKTAKDFKQAYMDKYSIQFEIPSADIQSSIFYPRNPNYLIQT